MRGLKWTVAIQSVVIVGLVICIALLFLNNRQDVQPQEAIVSSSIPEEREERNEEQFVLPVGAEEEEVPEPIAIPEEESVTADTDIAEEQPEQEPDPQMESVAAVMEQLREALALELSEQDGKWAVYAEDIETGYAIRAEQGITCDDSMVSASIVKMFVMACFYEKISQGEFSEDEVYPDIYQMITISDNEATNRLIKVLGYGDVEAGLAEVGAYASSIGCGMTSMHRLMLEDNGMQNYVSAADCAKLLRMIYEGKCVNGTYSDKMLSILKDQYWHDLLPAGLPEGTLCAHKSGALAGLSYGDVGIVYHADGPYIVCVICNDPIADGVCTDEIGTISGIIDGFMGQRNAELQYSN